MADKSVPQLNQITTINDTDLYHVVRNNIDYKITGEDIKRSISPYYEWTALISQFGGISSYTSGPLIGGAFYEIINYVAGDDFSNLELVSGTNNTNGAIYRATSVNPTTWSNGTELQNFLNPFVSSINPTTGEYAPFINTFPQSSPYNIMYDYNVNTFFEYYNPGFYYITFPFQNSSINAFVGNPPSMNYNSAIYSDSSKIWINTGYAGASSQDGLLDSTPITIKLYY